MKTKNGITVKLIQSNEIYDYFKITGNGHNEEIERPRSSMHTEQSILAEYVG